ncbi:MAG: hypothetical protein LUQ71_10250 [Methanoregula sp.]|nr:hypothetical protein [Methanoregula sp.]
MKKIIPILCLILVFVLIITGCVNSTDDKAFHDAAKTASPELITAYHNYRDVVDSGDLNKSVEEYPAFKNAMDNLISTLKEMPVTDKMEPIKEEYIAAWIRVENKSQLLNDAYFYISKGDYENANKTEEEIKQALKNENQDPNSTEFDNADQMYDTLYPIIVPTETTPTGYEIRITDQYYWQGNYGDVNGQQTISGRGDQEYWIDRPDGSLAVVIQKQDNFDEKLTVEVLKDGVVLVSKSTNSPYGVVTLSYTPGWFD